MGKMTNVKTRQQLEEERESFFKNTVLKVQQEAQLMSSRAKDDEMKRIEYLKSEEERIKREEILRQEAMLRAEEERKDGNGKTKGRNGKRKTSETATGGTGKIKEGKAKARGGKEESSYGKITSVTENRV